jgi:hypothetical protein
MDSLQSELDVLLGEQLLGIRDSQAYVDWAVRAMLAGYQSESLDILAGLDGEPRLVKQGYLHLAAHELGLRLSNDENYLLRQYANWVAIAVVSNRMLPELGLNKLYDVYVASDYCVDYSIFGELEGDLSGLLDGCGSIYGEIRHLGEKDQVIRHYCCLFLSCPLPLDRLPASSPGYDPDRAYCHRCRGRVDHVWKLRWSGWFPPRRRWVAVCASCGLEGVAVPGC